MIGRRRVRASFLLRCVILAACLTIGVAAGFIVGWSTLYVLLTVPILGTICRLSFEYLPGLLEFVAVRRAAAAGQPVDSIWFVDLEKIAEQENEHFRRQTEDNPTLR